MRRESSRASLINLKETLLRICYFKMANEKGLKMDQIFIDLKTPRDGVMKWVLNFIKKRLRSHYIPTGMPSEIHPVQQFEYYRCAVCGEYEEWDIDNPYPPWECDAGIVQVSEYHHYLCSKLEN